MAEPRRERSDKNGATVGYEAQLWQMAERDALTVLNEVGRRIKVVEVLEKLMADPEVDELHVIHPLVTQARGFKKSTLIARLVREFLDKEGFQQELPAAGAPGTGARR